MIEENDKSRARAQDSLTTQHLREVAGQEALTLSTEHLQNALVAESLTTAHLKQAFQAAEGQSTETKPPAVPTGNTVRPTNSTERK